MESTSQYDSLHSFPGQSLSSHNVKRRTRDSIPTYKVLMIGNVDVGKTCLLMRLCEDRFPREKKEYTLGFDMAEKIVEVDNEAVRLQLWDTTGTESYDSITTQYYRGGAGIILVYDTTSMASFQGLIRWYNYITIHAAPDVSLMLLGTKIDLDNKEVQTHEGKQFSETHEIPLFFEVSAKTGQGVRPCFEAFLKDVHRKAVQRNKNDNIIITPPPNRPNKSSCCNQN